MINITRNIDYFTVSNRFVDEFLCEANGSFVKVYLFVLRHFNNRELEMSDVVNSLNLLESDVIRAFKYWQKMGLIKFKQISEKDFSIEFLDEDYREVKTELPSVAEKKEEKIQTIAKPTTNPTAVSYTKSDINTYMKNNDGIRHMFLISEQLFNRPLTDTERKILFSFYDYLGMPVEVIFTLLEHCISCGKTNMRYIEKVAYTWADKGINTLAKASVVVKEENEFSALTKKYKSMFKITGRELTNTEEEFIRSWVYELKAKDEQIEAAYEAAVANTGKITFKYMDAVIKNNTSPQKITPKDTKQPVKRNFFQDYDDEISDYEVQLIKDRVNKN